MKQVKEKVGNYCAYRERCSQEVREKLEQYQCSEDEIEDLLCYFQSEGFLDDSRFVEAYAKDKFRQNKWGKIKIRQYLKQKRLPNDLIQAGLNQIPSDEYDAMIDGLVRRKYELVKGANDYIRSNKTAQSIIAKGFEPDLVWEVLKTIDDQSN
ncbi:MAG: regulatory protein RecX [Bacteroidota bacterium]